MLAEDFEERESGVKSLRVGDYFYLNFHSVKYFKIFWVSARIGDGQNKKVRIDLIILSMN